MTGQPCFDSIVLIEGGTSRRISSRDLAEMSIYARVAAILENRLQFYLGDVSVPLKVAMNAIRNGELDRT